MNKNIIKFFLLTTFILLISVSLVSASDMANDTSADVGVVSVENSVNKTELKSDKLSDSEINYYVSDTSGSDNNSGTNDSPFKTIQTALNKTTSAGVYNIYLGTGTYKGLGNTNLTVNGSHTINLIGSGVNSTILDGEASYTINRTGTVWGRNEYFDPYTFHSGNWALNISQGTGLIKINNLQIYNMISPGGTSISLFKHANVDNYGNLIVDNVYFKENLGGVGAGIRNNANTTLIVNNSIFEGNRKSNTTGNYGAGIYNNGTAIVENTEFIRNAARWGTVTNDKILNITNCTFRDGIDYDLASTFKTGTGIAIDTGSTDYYQTYNSTGIITNVENCTFTNNGQTDIYQGENGDLNINNSVFNQSTGIYFSRMNKNEIPNYITIINNSVFKDMIPSSLFGDLSGSNSVTFAIYGNRQGNLTIINCNISSNNRNAYSIIGVSNFNLTNCIIENKMNITNISIINENTINNNIYIKNNGSIVQNNNISTEGIYSIIIDGSNNTIINNNIQSEFLYGDTAVYTITDNIITNNTPTTTPNIITDTTYSLFFDNNNYLIDNNSVLYFGGEINNKNFIFNASKDLYLIAYTGSVLNNCTIVLQGQNKVFIENMTMNTTDSNKKYQLLINSTNNNITNSNFYTTNITDMQQIIINQDNNTLKNCNISSQIQNTTTKNNNDILAGLIIKSSNNNINNNTINLSGNTNNTLIGINIESSNNTENNQINNNTMNINSMGYIYGLKIKNTNNNTIKNNKYNITNNNEIYVIYLTGNITQNNINNETININSPNTYAITVEGDTTANNNEISQIKINITNTTTITGIKINNTNNTQINNITLYIENKTNGTFILIIKSENTTINNTNTNNTQYGINITQSKNTIINNTNTTTQDNTIIIENSQNTTINNTDINTNNTGIKIKNSTNTNITNNNINSTSNTIQLEDANNILILNNYMVMNNTNGGDLSIKNTNTNNITLTNNTPNIIHLTDNNYNEFFINQTLKTNNTQTVIYLDSDLYTKNMTFSNDLIFYGNNYTIYNGSINLNSTNIRIYNTKFNSTNNIETIIISINTNNTIYNSYIYHKSTSLIRTIINSTLTNSTVIVEGVEFETNDKTPSILIFNKTIVNKTNITVNTNGSTGYMNIIIDGIIRSSNLNITGNNITAITNTSIQFSDINITAKTYATVTNTSEVLNGLNINVTAKQTIAIINPTQLIGSKIYVYSDTNGSIILLNNTNGKDTQINTNDIIYGVNVNVIICENINSDDSTLQIREDKIILNNTLNKTFIPIIIKNTYIDVIIYGCTVVTDNLCVLVENASNINIAWGYMGANPNNFTSTGNCPVISIKNTDAVSIVGNSLISNTLRGNYAIETINVTKTTMSDNKPGNIITNDNYDTYFINSTYIFINDTSIELGSDIYNKSFIFNNKITINNPNNYTIYNGTISLKQQSSLNDLNLEYNGNNIILINGTYFTFYHGNIKVNGNNNIIFKNTIKSGNTIINYNNITVNGTNNTIHERDGYAEFKENNIYANVNNSTLFNLNQTLATAKQFAFNNISLIGDNNILILNNVPGMILNNNIEVNTSAPTTLIILNKGTMVQRNNITINATYEDTPVIYTKTTQVANNYIETLDVKGNDAVYTDSTAKITNNTPTTTDGYHAILNVKYPENLLNGTETTINVTATDSFGNLINNGRIYLITNNQTIISSIENSTAQLIYIASELGKQNITAILSSDKYTANNITFTINIVKLNTTINVTPLKGYINENLTLNITITDNNGNNVTEGNVYFIDDNSNVRSTTVNNGVATLTGFNTTYTGNMIIRYAGTSGYYASNTTTNITITKHNTTITVDNVVGVVGESITLIARITDESGNNVTSGRVLFKINGITLRDANGNVIYVNVTRGVARLTLTAVRGWTNTNAYISANYAGNSIYLTSASKNNTVNIAKRNATIEIINDTRVYKAGDTITITAIVTDSNGQLATSGQVVFKLNGVTLKDRNGKTIMVNVVKGIATLTYTLPSTFADYNYTITAIFAGGDYNRQVSKNSTLQVVKTSIHMDLDPVIITTNTATIKAKIYDGNNKQITGTTRVTIKLNGVTIINSQNITNGNLQFTINTPYPTGLYNMTIIAGPSSVYEQLQRNTTLVIMKN